VIYVRIDSFEPIQANEKSEMTFGMKGSHSRLPRRSLVGKYRKVALESLPIATL